MSPIYQSCRRLAVPALLLLIAAGGFVPGIRWGLPTRAEDRYLFGENEPIWPAEDVVALTEGDDNPDRASDVDANPVDRTRVTLVNASDEQRAEIIRRYRLFTYQPDEMQTMMALAAMKPGARDFDPRNYKYGGLWIYPVGALLKVASMFGWVDLRSDLAFYIDRPDAFANFYVVARAYTIAWAMIGACAVWWLARRLSPSPLVREGRGEGEKPATSLSVDSERASERFTPHPNPLPQGDRGPSAVAAFVAAICFIFMPVVMNMSHEAKPHLPGAILILLTAIAGIRYLDTSRKRWLWLTGALAGAAMGMVPSAWVAFAVLLGIAVVRREIVAPVVAGLVGVIVYIATNPFVAINLLVDRNVLASNFGNTAAFYHVGWNAIPNAARLVRAGMSSPLAVASFVAVAALGIAVSRNREVAARLRPMWLVALPAIVSGAQFVLFAADQPPDYARFAVTLDIALMLAAIVAIPWLVGSRVARGMLYIVLLAPTLVCGLVMLRGFVRDSHQITSRMLAAEELAKWQAIGARRLVVFSEPAPYSVPPVDLFGWEILLMPREADERHVALGDVVVRVWDDPNDPFGRSIGWADRSFIIQATPRFLGVDNQAENEIISSDN